MVNIIALLRFISCLFVFGFGYFRIPAMLLILISVCFLSKVRPATLPFGFGRKVALYISSYQLLFCVLIASLGELLGI